MKYIDENECNSELHKEYVQFSDLHTGKLRLANVQDFSQVIYDVDEDTGYSDGVKYGLLIQKYCKVFLVHLLKICSVVLSYLGRMIG